MNIRTQLEALKKLIIENTEPPLTDDLLGKLSFIAEQYEAHSDDVARQDKTLATQIKTIERLVKENFEKDRKLLQVESDRRKANDDWFIREHEKQVELLKSRQLKSFD